MYVLPPKSVSVDRAYDCACAASFAWLLSSSSRAFRPSDVNCGLPDEESASKYAGMNLREDQYDEETIILEERPT